ncbi:MAG: restriction endonuclease subunit S, partial [Pseudomonadales bacterium]
MRAGWQTKNLGDVCEVIGGGTPSKDNPAYYLGEIPWATVRDMRQEVITETECQITKEAVKSSATNIIPSGNVVIATRVGLGKVCLLGQDTAINQDLRGIIPRNPNVLLVRFLFWWFKSIADVIVAEGTGATVQGVKLPFVKSLPLPVPPLSEQHRIVAILDEAFDGIATAKANTEKNLQNARALFDSHLQSVFTERGEGWVEPAKQLSELCELIVDCEHKTAPIQKVGFPSIRTTNIGKGKLLLDGVNRVSQETYDAWTRRAIPQPGDLIFAREAPAGHVAGIP